METNQKDLLVLNLISTEIVLSTKQDDKSEIKTCSKEPEQEGSLQTIEKPQEHNDTTILKTEAQIEEANPRNANTIKQEEEITDGIHGVTKSKKLPKEEEFPKEEKKEETESKTNDLENV